MHRKSSWAAGVALGALLAANVCSQAAAKPHHQVAKGPDREAQATAALEAKVDALSQTVSALQARLDAETQDRQSSQAEVDAAKAEADSARAEAAAARAQLAEQIQTIPGEVHTAVAAAQPKAPNVKVTLGGFAAAEGVYRSKQDVADIGSNYSKIPYDNSALSHMSELRGTARQSRLSVLVQGDVNPTTHAAFYGEFDFLGAAQTANSNESNSYNPRIRNVYGTVDWDDSGLHLLAGQSWSLATMNGHGITARAEVIPPTIEAQYVPGFVWARQPQIRIVKDFNKQLWIAVSLENPQTTFAGGLTGVSSTASGVSANTSNPGISLLANVNNFSYNHVPDVVAKVAYEPMIGGAQPLHLEVFGIWRDFYDRVTYGAGNAVGATPGITNIDTSGGGVGGGVTWTVVPKMLDVEASYMTGRGIGRYGSGQLPDTVVAANGSLQPIPEQLFLVGGTLHATPALDLYALYGEETEGREAVQLIGSTSFGYGSPNASLAGCLVEGGTCSPDTKQINQITVGFWDKFYSGKFGSLRLGIQYSHTDLTAFPGLLGVTPKTNDDMLFTSFRYYPAF